MMEESGFSFQKKVSCQIRPYWGTQVHNTEISFDFSWM